MIVHFNHFIGIFKGVHVPQFPTRAALQTPAHLGITMAASRQGMSQVISWQT